VNRDKSPGTLNDDKMRVPVAVVKWRQRAALREISVNSGLTTAQRDLLLEEYRRGIRRVNRHVALGDDLAARAALAVLELFLGRAKKYPQELVYGIGLVQRLKPAMQRISERISIDYTDEDDVDALQGLTNQANLFAYMSGVAKRGGMRIAQRIKPAVEGNQNKGKKRRDLAVTEAQKLLQKNHKLSRDRLAMLIAPKLQISEDHARKLLTGLSRSNHRN
jgi:hypothetical protein